MIWITNNQLFKEKCKICIKKRFWSGDNYCQDGDGTNLAQNKDGAVNCPAFVSRFVITEKVEGVDKLPKSCAGICRHLVIPLQIGGWYRCECVDMQYHVLEQVKKTGVCEFQKEYFEKQM